MLTALRIRNVVLIEALAIDFKAGLCALTGETGAGKSILLDSLGLALGARAEARLVRKGAEQASVSAEFEIAPSHPAYDLMKEADLMIEPGEALIVRRTLNEDGRSKAFVNDQPVSVALLKALGETLVEIHGQFETQGLLNPGTHLGLLDEYAGVEGVLETPWKSWKKLQTVLEEKKSQAENAREQEEFLRQSLEDLDALSPEPGEEEKLSNLRESLMHRERVLEGLNVAYHALSGEEDPVRKAWGALDRIADKASAELGEAIAALDRASSETQEAMAIIQSVSSDLEQSEESLETIDDRLFALRAQARKHGCTVDALSEKREEIAAALNAIEHEDETLATLMRQVEKARADYITQAEETRKKRQKAAEKLDRLVAKELAPLKLEKARFFTTLQALEEEDWSAHGMDQVRFLVATNPGADPGPLNKIASGGEMSRFMLALKVVMAEVGTAETLIFDEVDAGIGGSTADAVGERLAKLSQGKQVLVVTHAPQVAARAHHHWIVRKGGAKELKTDVAALPDPEARREEIARMLAGATITDEARAAADKLLETGI